MGALIAGFPVALAFAWYHGHKGLKSFSPAEMTIVAMLMLIGAGGLIVFIRPSTEHEPAQVAEEEVAGQAPSSTANAGCGCNRRKGRAACRTRSEIADAVQKDRYGSAFTLALPLIGEAQAKEDANFQELWRQIALPIRPLVSEAGATVYFKPYEDTDGDWIKAGVTPFTKAIDAPRGVLQLKIEKPGFRTGTFVIHNPGPSVENDPPDPEIAGISFAKVPLPLAAEGMIPDDMVLVPHTNLPVYVAGLVRSTSSWRHRSIRHPGLRHCAERSHQSGVQRVRRCRRLRQSDLLGRPEVRGRWPRAVLGRGEEALRRYDQPAGACGLAAQHLSGRPGRYAGRRH